MRPSPDLFGLTEATSKANMRPTDEGSSWKLASIQQADTCWDSKAQEARRRQRASFPRSELFCGPASHDRLDSFPEVEPVTPRADQRRLHVELTRLEDAFRIHLRLAAQADTSSSHARSRSSTSRPPSTTPADGTRTRLPPPCERRRRDCRGGGRDTVRARGSPQPVRRPDARRCLAATPARGAECRRRQVRETCLMSRQQSVDGSRRSLRDDEERPAHGRFKRRCLSNDNRDTPPAHPPRQQMHRAAAEPHRQEQRSEAPPRESGGRRGIASTSGREKG